ncbi:MAG TPA: VOC family protein [Pararobbsia sp.]|nr:VOC family protein [Pararobbsia sp.]
MSTPFEPTMTILYVDNPVRSAAFYADLLGKQPVESSPTFAAFRLESGVMLGLWSKHTVEPAAQAGGGGCEVVFGLPDYDTVGHVFADWSGRGLRILQAPVELDFGRTFVALDPDGHRLRAFAMAPQQEAAMPETGEAR